MIDWRKVAELRDEIGAEDLAEIVDVFQAEIEEVIEQLRKGVAEERLEDCFHSLKGSGLNLGFAAFAEICGAVEQAARAGAFDRVDISAVIARYEQSMACFERERLERLMTPSKDTV